MHSRLPRDPSDKPKPSHGHPHIPKSDFLERIFVPAGRTGDQHPSELGPLGRQLSLRYSAPPLPVVVQLLRQRCNTEDRRKNLMVSESDALAAAQWCERTGNVTDATSCNVTMNAIVVASVAHHLASSFRLARARLRCRAARAPASGSPCGRPSPG